MKKYILVTSGSGNEFEQLVSQKIDEGYQPCGGAWEGANGFSQAMILSGIKAVQRELENSPTREDYRYPRNMHVVGDIDDTPF